MALFTDGLPAAVEDLTALDSQLLSVASTEGIDVTQKLALAQQEIRAWLDELPAPAGCVVVTASLRLWHSYKALELVYADAYNSQLNDRYAAKREQFRKMARTAREQLMSVGIGITVRPIPRAQSPVLSEAAGSLPDATYYVAASWVNEAGEEGECSVESSIATVSSTFRAELVRVPPGAVGWNLYAGGDPGAMRLQNDAPIAPGAAWLQSRPVSGSGPSAAGGQRPNYFQPAPRRIRRG